MKMILTAVSKSMLNSKYHRYPFPLQIPPILYLTGTILFQKLDIGYTYVEHFTPLEAEKWRGAGLALPGFLK